MGRTTETIKTKNSSSKLRININIKKYYLLLIFSNKFFTMLLFFSVQGESNTNASYNEIKATTQELMKVNQYISYFFISKTIRSLTE